MFKVEQQDGPECMLATIAALAGKPLAEARAIACAVAGVSKWAKLAPGAYQKGVEGLCHAYDPTGLLLALVGRAYTLRRVTNPGAEAGGQRPRVVRHLSKSQRSLPAKGEGTVTVGRGRSGHIAAWCDGLVYDSNHPDQPMSLATFRLHYRTRFHYAVKQITYTR